MVWQYLVTDFVDGKPPGWYPYDAKASAQLDAVSADCRSTKSRRLVYNLKSGYFSYDVNLLTMVRRNLSTGTVRQIRRSIPTLHPEPAKKKLKSDPTEQTKPVLALEPLFAGLYGHVWSSVLTPFLSALPNVSNFLGPNRPTSMLPLRELTFQALKPNPPDEWRVVVFGQNPYPRIESATGVAMFDAAIDDWEDKKFGSTVSIRNIIKAAAITKYNFPKTAKVAELRHLLNERDVLSPPQWFQAMLAQGVLLLNAALTVQGGMSGSDHQKFWRPVVERIIEEILAAKSALLSGDSRRGIVFLWWGTKAADMKKRLSAVLDKYDNSVDVRHIEWCNPADRGDRFCEDPPHFARVNEQLDDLGVDPIDWLPDQNWMNGPGAGSGVFGDFVTDTKKLHALYLARLRSGLECAQVLEPITGVMAMPHASIVEACAPLGLHFQAESARTAVQVMHSGTTLTEDEKSAIYMYTGNSLYSSLNAALRSPQRQDVKIYFSYLSLFLKAHKKLPGSPTVLYRGIHKDLRNLYKEGSKITWWSISSCSSNVNVAKKFGSEGTLFHVQAKTAVPIMGLSAYKTEEEYVLAPGTQLRVVKVAKKEGGMTQIFLEELDGKRLVE